MKKDLWTCTSCGRQFINKNQDHSCGTKNIEIHLANKPEPVRQICGRLLSWAMTHKDVRIDVVKNAILVRRHSTFFALKPTKTFVNLEFVLSENKDEFPVYKTVKVSAKKYAHFIKIENPEEVDHQLLQWLEKAWEIS
ncbi:MAG: DUF5655 domain-containing protein [Bacteroidales bacterium]|jgi:hypothetical protein|nr:DUF5655 domain-containing protein [Bacteroidales bacterium]